jgi:branched-chain amino acid transport system ATP-binding protein
MLKLNNIEVLYHAVILVLKGISVEVPTGKIVTLLGANGAGKTTTLKAISGLLKMEEGSIDGGTIEFEGKRIDRLSPGEIVRTGIVQVLEGRQVLKHLTVEENLLLGSYLRKDRLAIKNDRDMVCTYFPILRTHVKRTSGYLSGGEQQMLVIGRALMANPKVMLLDEPSLGLAPLLIDEIFVAIKRINVQKSTSILLVEQNAVAALAISDYGYVMENGRVVLDGNAQVLKENEDIKEFYLGLTQVGEKRRYQDVKHYKRRKRWLG